VYKGFIRGIPSEPGCYVFQSLSGDITSSVFFFNGKKICDSTKAMMSLDEFYAIGNFIGFRLILLADDFLWSET